MKYTLLSEINILTGSLLGKYIWKKDWTIIDDKPHGKIIAIINPNSGTNNSRKDFNTIVVCDMYPGADNGYYYAYLSSHHLHDDGSETKEIQALNIYSPEELLVIL